MSVWKPAGFQTDFIDRNQMNKDKTGIFPTICESEYSIQYIRKDEVDL